MGNLSEKLERHGIPTKFRDYEKEEEILFQSSHPRPASILEQRFKQVHFVPSVGISSASNNDSYVSVMAVPFSCSITVPSGLSILITQKSSSKEFMCCAVVSEAMLELVTNRIRHQHFLLFLDPHFVISHTVCRHISLCSYQHIIKYNILSKLLLLEEKNVEKKNTATLLTFDS